MPFYCFVQWRRVVENKNKYLWLFKCLAPGAYSPEKANLDHQPAYSFGSRPEEKVRSGTPGKLCTFPLFSVEMAMVNYEK